MPYIHTLRKLCLIAANILIPVAAIIFATGFFPYKPFLPGLASWNDDANEEIQLLKEVERPRRVFDKVVFMVVDALRSDFVYGVDSGFDFTQSLIRDGNAIPFTAHATPPTITMPRVKALTTGSVPSFLDVILNFAESDTTSTLATQDTWLAQLRAHLHADAGTTNASREGKIVFYGDDTWLKLFPSFFAASDGTTSFFVSDFTEVDQNVTRHVPSTLSSPDWDCMIMHYLGLDHIGHKAGPKSPNMIPKQREMDGIVQQIFTAMQTQPHLESTLLVLAGDHGMNSGGNHGGSAPGETEPALLFASPKFADMPGREAYAAPTKPREGRSEFEYYRKVEQNDLVPTLSGLLGIPIPKNNLGIFIPELLGFWKEQDGPSKGAASSADGAPALSDGGLQLLYRNALQVLEIVKATFGETSFSQLVGSTMTFKTCSNRLEGKQELQCKWGLAQRMLLAGSRGRFTVEEQAKVLTDFLQTAQDTLSTTASSYDVSRLVTGALVASIATVLGFCSIKRPFFTSVPLLAFAVLTILYGVMMFASSYVEEEQHFWYWTTATLILYLGTIQVPKASGTGSLAKSLTITAASLALHRISVRWNQTGQKHAGEPDISRHFFPEHHLIMWALVIATYARLGFRLHRALLGFFVTEVSVIAAVVTILPAFVFKLNFTQADAPELVRGLASQIRERSEPFGLVLQAQVVFTALAILTIGMFAQWLGLRRTKINFDGHLASSLHDVLAVFLVTQTRVNNVPLFLLFDVQFQLLRRLLSTAARGSAGSPNGLGSNKVLPLVSITTLLFSHSSYFFMGGTNAISTIDLSNAYNGISGYNVVGVGALLFFANWAGPIWWSSAGVLLLHSTVAALRNDEQDRIRKENQASYTRLLEQMQLNGRGDLVEVHDEELLDLKVEAAMASEGLVGPEDMPDGRLKLDKADAERVRRIKEVNKQATKFPRPSFEGLDGAWQQHAAILTTFVASSLLAVMLACTALRTHLFIWTVFSPKYLYAMAWSIGWHWLITLGLGGFLNLVGRPNLSQR